MTEKTWEEVQAEEASVCAALDDAASVLWPGRIEWSELSTVSGFPEWRAYVAGAPVLGAGARLQPRRLLCVVVTDRDSEGLSLAGPWAVDVYDAEPRRWGAPLASGDADSISGVLRCVADLFTVLEG